MAHGTSILERVGEHVREGAGKAVKATVKEVGNVGAGVYNQVNFIQDIYRTSVTKEEAEVAERREQIAQTEGFARYQREIDAMKKGVVSTETIDPVTQAKIEGEPPPEVTEEIQEKQAKVDKKFSEFERDEFERAKDLTGTPQQKTEDQEREEREKAEAEAKAAKEEEKEQKMELLPESNSKTPQQGGTKRQTGRNRMPKPKATKSAEKSMESNAGKGIGG